MIWIKEALSRQVTMPSIDNKGRFLALRPPGLFQENLEIDPCRQQQQLLCDASWSSISPRVPGGRLEGNLHTSISGRISLREIGENGNFAVAVAGRLFQTNHNPPQV
ncbi:hypothetical protein AY599_06770 [Leptolyngbya valderiana BDU 20041]|nr:hypothetical protein AY599_06770 [Leptolyngbya valderiana BDU 20041]